MTMQTIAIDADDTLFDENTAVRVFHNQKYGTQHTAEDYLIPGQYGAFWEHLWQTDAKETLRRYEEFIEHKLKHNLPPLPGAISVLKELKKDYQLVVVTSRDARGQDITQEALADHYPDIFSAVHFVYRWGGNEKATKANICKDIGADYLIDDSYEHCKLAAEAGVVSLLFGTYGWNRMQKLLPGMTRVKDWSEVLEYFYGKDR